MCEIVKALKLPFWIIFSLLLHCLFATALWWSNGSSLIKNDIEVVDLTLAPVNLESDTPASSAPPLKAAAKPKMPAKALAFNTTDNEVSKTVTADGSSDHQGPAEESDTSTASALLGWKEVTRLPKVLKEVKAAYPASAKQAQIAGAVVLDIVIAQDGKVREVRLIQGPGHGLNESAMEALKQFQFSPAYKDNAAVAVKIRYTYRFKLDVN